MIESAEDLVSSLDTLSNHFQKYAPVVGGSSQALRLRLDEAGLTGRVQMWRSAHDYGRQLAAVRSLARDPAEGCAFLGTYYALQLLHLHLLNIHWLRRDAGEYGGRLKLYRQILSRARFRLRDLTASYLTALVDLFAGGRPMDGVAICNVGMILDQDDLDVGVFVRPDIDRAFWNRVVSQVGTEFLKYASKMHFYLAERVADQTYLTTADDFKAYLRLGAHNFVLISELLLTEHLAGDDSPVQQLRGEVIDQFYFDRGSRRLHEGYLRGMIGEVESLLWADLHDRWVSPKSHGLRLIHNMMSMLKTIHGIREHGSRDVIERLRAADHEHAALYGHIQDIFSFIEMFFHVYQLFVSVEDSFDFHDTTAMENLDRVADVMGYPALGPVRPAQRLLTHYYERIDWLRALAHQVVDQVNRHLRRVTVFRRLAEGERPRDYPLRWTDNFALNVLRMFRIYRGMIYWDDILELMAADGAEVLGRLVDSLEELSPEQRVATFHRLLRLLSFDMSSLIRAATLLRSHPQRAGFERYGAELNHWLLGHLAEAPDRLEALLELGRVAPASLADYLLGLDSEQLLALHRLAAPPGLPPPPGRASFGVLCRLLAFSSPAFRDTFARVVVSRPEMVPHLDNLDYLGRLSGQVWAELTDSEGPDELKRRLALFHDYTHISCSLYGIVQPQNLRELYARYHSAFRRYFRWLYRACQWEMESQGLPGPTYRDRDDDDQPLAIFCTGGYAREEAFETDIDLFVVCREEGPEFHAYATRLVNLLNRDLSRQGVRPHYRLGERFESFVIPLEALDRFLTSPQEGDFIDISQLLSRRRLVGSPTFEAELAAILQQRMQERSAGFIRDMLGELAQRQAYWRAQGHRRVNVKEDPGALRDIQMIVLALQAAVGLHEPIVWKALRGLEQALPGLAGALHTLERSYRFIRFFRDNYTLARSGSNDISRDQLLATARRMGLADAEISGGTGTSARLLASYRYHRRRARRAIAELSAFLRLHADRLPAPPAVPVDGSRAVGSPNNSSVG